MLTTTLANKIGDIEYAKVLNDDNLLVRCADAVQLGKALKVKEITGVQYVLAWKN